MALDFSWNDGERVMFIGDSLTEDPQGYTRLIPTMVSARYPELKIDYFPRGVGGNRITDLFERMDRDIFGNDPTPTWVSLSIGINDVWHGATGTPAGRFREVYDALVSRVLDTGATLACLTTTVLSEELGDEKNAALVPYNDVIREIAAAHGALIVDVNTAFHDAIQRAQSRNPNFRFTTDGVQLNTYGQYLMSMVILGALNFSL